MAPPQLELSGSIPALVDRIYIFGEVNVIGGPTGAGKTAFEVWMQSQVLRGEPFLGRQTTRPPWWGVIATDRSMLARRLFWKAAGMEELPYFCLPEAPDAEANELVRTLLQDDLSSMKLLRGILDKLKPERGGVVTIDVGNLWAGDSRLSYKNGFAHGFVLGRVAQQYGLTLLLVMHGGKQRKHDAYLRLVDRIIASTGFLGAVGTLSYLTSREESSIDGLQEFQWQSHYHPAETFFFKRTSEGLFEMADPEQYEKKPKPGSEKEEPRTVEWRDRWERYLPWFPPLGAESYLPTMEYLRRCEEADVPRRTAERDLEDMEGAGVILRRNGERGKWQRRMDD